jgi:antitoxin component YwqK of YwqJK toxin-antitoxin module
MKNLLKSLPLLLILISCSQGEEVFQYNKKEYWKINGEIDSTKLKDDINVYFNGNDTLLFWKSYYLNGKQRAHVKFGNLKLLHIYSVNDTLGNKLNYGNIKNGNGYIYVWDRDGYLHESGQIEDGKRNGWWRTYHFKGEILDSSFFKKGKLDDMGDFEFCYY